ncbi:MAG: hypothetical protein LBV43_12265 [Prevotella sp.]|jgi:hypothetical protein|nr:hypothetical protein [Prevotella sp.]
MSSLEKYTLFGLFTLILLVSCGDDDDKGILRYVESQSGTESFTMYAGSEDGGIVVDPDSIKIPQTTYFPNSTFESYASTTFSFTNDNVVMVEQSTPAERNEYKFEDGSFYLFKAGEYRYFGDGDKSIINIRQHYIGYKQQGESTFSLMQATPQKDIDADKAAAETPYGSIENMKSEGDTLIWCTHSSYFR